MEKVWSISAATWRWNQPIATVWCNMALKLVCDKLLFVAVRGLANKSQIFDSSVTISPPLSSLPVTGVVLAPRQTALFHLWSYWMSNTFAEIVLGVNFCWRKGEMHCHQIWEKLREGQFYYIQSILKVPQRLVNYISVCKDCCRIDKSNNKELIMPINSVFRSYQRQWDNTANYPTFRCIQKMGKTAI
jgi:hypothetical protein